jgi:hypothetical protein
VSKAIRAVSGDPDYLGWLLPDDLPYPSINTPYADYVVRGQGKTPSPNYYMRSAVVTVLSLVPLPGHLAARH